MPCPRPGAAPRAEAASRCVIVQKHEAFAAARDLANANAETCERRRLARINRQDAKGANVSPRGSARSRPGMREASGGHGHRTPRAATNHHPNLGDAVLGASAVGP